MLKFHNAKLKSSVTTHPEYSKTSNLEKKIKMDRKWTGHVSFINIVHINKCLWWALDNLLNVNLKVTLEKYFDSFSLLFFISYIISVI
jgi:hypothetical protein